MNLPYLGSASGLVIPHLRHGFRASLEKVDGNHSEASATSSHTILWSFCHQKKKKNFEE